MCIPIKLFFVICESDHKVVTFVGEWLCPCLVDSSYVFFGTSSVILHLFQLAP